MKDKEAGIATLEILIALAIIALSTSAVIMVVFGSQSISVDAQISQEALYKAQTTLEEVKASARSNWDNIATNSTTEEIFTKNTIVEDLNDLVKRVTSSVNWQVPRVSNVSLSTLVTDWQSAISGNSCDQTLSGDWKNFQHHDFATSLSISDLKIYSQKLYVTVDSTSNRADPTFYIYNIPQDPSSAPSLSSSLDNAPTVSTGLKAVAISEKYVYVANAYAGSAAGCAQGSNCAQLQVIDISNASPVIVKNLKISAFTSGGNLAVGNSIFYSKGYVYLGLAKASGSGFEFNIIDVGAEGSNATPLNPIWKGGYQVGNGVNAIFVKGNHAYIVSPNSENLTIIDVSNPVNPIRVGGYTPPTANNGKSIYVNGNNVFLGRTFGTNEFYILDKSNPSSISVKGSKDIGIGNGTSINTLKIRDHLAFLLTNSQFQIWDIANPANIVPWTADGTSNGYWSLAGTGAALHCLGNYFYAAISSGTGSDTISAIVPEP